MGQTSSTVSQAQPSSSDSSTNSSTGSSEESENEVLIATPLIQTQSTLKGRPLIHTQPTLKGRTSPFLLSFVNQYDQQSEVTAVSKELTDTMPDNDSNDSLYPIISDASNDSIFDHLSDIGIEVETQSATSSRSEGNIPNLEALGVEEMPREPRVSFFTSRSFSTPSKASWSPSSQTDDYFGVRNKFSSRLFGKRNKSNPIPIRSPRSETLESGPFQFCTTSTQSAIVEKLKLRQLDSSDDDDDDYNFLKDKTTLHHDSDKGLISSKSRHAESDIDTAYRDSVKQSSMTPMLKAELKLKIQVERMKRGEPDVVLKEEEPKDYLLRPEEIEKKEKRLEQNRKSARKSRIMANRRQQLLEKSIKEEMIKSTRLRQEIRKLRVFRETLRKELDDHLKVCKGTTRHQDDPK